MSFSINKICKIVLFKSKPCLCDFILAFVTTPSAELFGIDLTWFYILGMNDWENVNDWDTPDIRNGKEKIR